MFNTNIEDRLDIITSKLEYTKKKRFIAKDEKYKATPIINKAINNEKLTLEEYKTLLSQLEFTFKKRLLERMNSDIIDNRRLEDYKTKTDKALYIFENIKNA